MGYAVVHKHAVLAQQTLQFGYDKNTTTPPLRIPLHERRDIMIYLL